MTAIGKYKKDLETAVSLAMGNEFFVMKSKNDLRRLSMAPAAIGNDTAFLKQVMKAGA